MCVVGGNVFEMRVNQSGNDPMFGWMPTRHRVRDRRTPSPKAIVAIRSPATELDLSWQPNKSASIGGWGQSEVNSHSKWTSYERPKLSVAEQTLLLRFLSAIAAENWLLEML